MRLTAKSEYGVLAAIDLGAAAGEAFSRVQTIRQFAGMAQSIPFSKAIVKNSNPHIPPRLHPVECHTLNE